jgi:hypothetical protein
MWHSCGGGVVVVVMLCLPFINPLAPVWLDI